MAGMRVLGRVRLALLVVLTLGSRIFRQEGVMTRLVRLVAASLLGLLVVLPHHAFAQNATQPKVARRRIG
jgi:hypothetical protein